MNASPCEFLSVVNLVEKYGNVFVVELVQEATDYLHSQGQGFIVSR